MANVILAIYIVPMIAPTSARRASLSVAGGLSTSCQSQEG